MVLVSIKVVCRRLPFMLSGSLIDIEPHFPDNTKKVRHEHVKYD